MKRTVFKRAAGFIRDVLDFLPVAPDAETIMRKLKHELDNGRALSQQDRNYLMWAAERLHGTSRIEDESPVVRDLWQKLKDLGISSEALGEALLYFLDSGSSEKREYRRTLWVLRQKLE